MARHKLSSVLTSFLLRIWRKPLNGKIGKKLRKNRPRLKIVSQNKEKILGPRRVIVAGISY